MEISRSDMTSHFKSSSLKIMKSRCCKLYGWEQQFVKYLTPENEILLNILKVLSVCWFQAWKTSDRNISANYFMLFSPWIVSKFTIYKTNTFTPNVRIHWLWAGEKCYLFCCTYKYVYSYTAEQVTSYLLHEAQGRLI